MQGAPLASAGGVLQLWLEASFLLAAVAGLCSSSVVLAHASSRLQAAIDARVAAAVAAVVAAGSEEAELLTAWLGGGQQLSLGAAKVRLQQLSKQVQAEARCNLAPLQQLGGVLPP